MAYQNELYHHGILGMKWGVRRYQNKDGSLTPSGKKRYAKLNSELNKLRPGASNTRQSEYNKHMGVSDDELKARINRLKLEDEYAQLASKLNPKKVKDGESFVVKAGKYAAKSIFDAWVKKTFELDDQGKKKDGKQGKQDSSNKNNNKPGDSKTRNDPKAKTDAYRDDGCDMGLADYPIGDKIYVHHMNPITPEMVEENDPVLFEPEFLICVSYQTHNAIHYGDKSLLPQEPIQREPNDTCPWRK